VATEIFYESKNAFRNSTTFADNLTNHQEIYEKFCSFVAAAIRWILATIFKTSFSENGGKTTLCFLIYPDQGKFEELYLSCLY